jgi:peptide deformylase
MGHPVLRQKARELSREELLSKDTQRLIDDMTETMRDADGVGLAAPQVFEGIRLLLAEVRASEEDPDSGVPLLALANPLLVKTSEEVVDGWEGCLSIPEIYGIVPRYRRITVKGWDRRAKPVTVEAEGYFARILQHEMDHLDGVLFLDRMRDMHTLTYKKEMYRFWISEEE